MEITFVNKDDVFQYYNDNVPADEMVFKRTPSQIGRNVELRHPPKVLDKVKTKVQAELKAEFETKLSEKELEIKNLKKKIGSKEFNAEERDQESAPEAKPSQASALLTRTKKHDKIL